MKEKGKKKKVKQTKNGTNGWSKLKWKCES